MLFEAGVAFLSGYPGVNQCCFNIVFATRGGKMKTQTRLAVVGLLVLAGGGLAYAQAGKSKPPVAQAWMDVATYSGMGMMGMGGGTNPMSMLGGAFGGGGRNTFGNTMTGKGGSWLDVTLFTRNNSSLAEATQSVPVNSKLAPELKLVSPKLQKTPPTSDDEVVREEFEPPKGKIYLYWGCGDTVRPGQPQVLDMAKASPADYQKFFVGRRATQRGAHLADGRPSWPNEQDARLVPEGASLIGEHLFKGQGVPDGFKFALGQAQDRSDLAIRLLLDLAQDHDGPIVLVQLEEGLLHHLRLLLLLKVRIQRRVVRLHVAELVFAVVSTDQPQRHRLPKVPPLLRAHPVLPGIDRDAVDPGRNLAVSSETWQGLDGPQQGVLGEVFRVRAVAGQAQS